MGGLAAERVSAAREAEVRRCLRGGGFWGGLLMGDVRSVWGIEEECVLEVVDFCGSVGNNQDLNDIDSG